MKTFVDEVLHSYLFFKYKHIFSLANFGIFAPIEDAIKEEKNKPIIKTSIKISKKLSISKNQVPKDMLSDSEEETHFSVHSEVSAGTKTYFGVNNFEVNVE